MMAGASLAAVLASMPAWAQPTEIKACQQLSPGSYVLANNILANTDTCLKVSSGPSGLSNGTTIDLAGYAIAGPTNGISGGNNVTVRNGSFAVKGVAVDLGDGAIVEGLKIILGAGGIIANGIVKENTVINPQGFATEEATGISAIGVITNNYLSGVPGYGIVVGKGSTVIGNTSVNNTNTGVGISADCPAKLIDNTAVGYGQNLVLNGTGCNVAP